MDDLLDSDRAGEGFGLSRKSDQRGRSPKGQKEAITNQPAPMTPFEELQRQKAAEAAAADSEEEDDDDIEFEEEQQSNLGFKFCKGLVCLPISKFTGSDLGDSGRISRTNFRFRFIYPVDSMLLSYKACDWL